MRIGFVGLGMVLAGCGFRLTGSTEAPPADDAAALDGPPGDMAVADAPIDTPVDAPIDAHVCPPPPAGCAGFVCPGSASCYFVCSQKVAWPTARNRCEAASGCLATINDAPENSCIQLNALPDFPDLVWFGFRQGSSAPEPAGGWSWRCPPSTFVAPNWGGFEPNDYGQDEDCAGMMTNGAWLDGACDYEARYVCEL